MFFLISYEKNRKRRTAVLTRNDSCKNFGEIFTHCRYFLQNNHEDLKYFDIGKIIWNDVIKIWQSENPHLLLYEEYYVDKMADRVCFKKASKINRKGL